MCGRQRLGHTCVTAFLPLSRMRGGGFRAGHACVAHGAATQNAEGGEDAEDVEPGGTAWKVVEGCGGRWNTGEDAGDADGREWDGRPWRGVEGRRGPWKTVEDAEGAEGRGRPRKAAEGRGRPRKAAEG
eukprot:gene12900-biopygen3503